LKILFEFSAAEITLKKNRYLPHSESKSYQMNFPLNPARQDLPNNTKGTSQFLFFELNGRDSSVTMSSTDFSFQNLVFLKFI
jgi:hypothetical protein